ncbi:hypothetical protein GALL_469240 [mine drainage metagenome]|uniref:Uncharacterized protein n=1 Tax=mine drainage metagenome TaxID=410659 RepID=A0A1J5PV54_9ZZZZ
MGRALGTVASWFETRVAALLTMRSWHEASIYRRVSRQPAASASSTEQNQRVPLLIFISIFAYQRLLGV